MEDAEAEPKSENDEQEKEEKRWRERIKLRLEHNIPSATQITPADQMANTATSNAQSVESNAIEDLDYPDSCKRDDELWNYLLKEADMRCEAECNKAGAILALVLA